MSVMLNGLDGANPLGFLAALGTQQALADQGVPARMRWVDAGGWRPEMVDIGSMEKILDVLQRDLESWQEAPALDLKYPVREKKSGKQKIDKNGQPLLERDLKPLPEEYSNFMSALRSHGGRSEQLALAFATDVGIDGSGFVKPTALHFTAGQQRFLEMVRQLRQEVTLNHLREALEGPWLRRDELPVLGWDAASERMYALRAFDPSKDGKTGTAGAEWLAFLGIRCFPTVPVGPTSNMTTGMAGSWKKGSFRWQIWTGPLSPAAACAAVQQAYRASELSPRALKAWGIGRIFESTIQRTDQGGYGSFSPPEIIR